MKGALAWLVWGLALWVWGPGQQPDPTMQALADYRLQHAKVRIAQACREIEEETEGRQQCRTPIKVVEWPPALMPPGVLAMTTVQAGSCRLTFTPTSIRDNTTLAHEACHCAWDAPVIGERGWAARLSPAEVEMREERAKVCGKEKGGRP